MVSEEEMTRWQGTNGARGFRRNAWRRISGRAFDLSVCLVLLALAGANMAWFQLWSARHLRFAETACELGFRHVTLAGPGDLRLADALHSSI